MTSKNKIDELFDLLDKWRYLPAYQLERRADIFFAIYLKEIISYKFKGEEIEHIIPEFPVRLGDVIDRNLSNPNLSYKIDYVAVGKNPNKVYLIELKTDVTSLRTEQDNYLRKVKEKGIKQFVGGVLKICAASSSSKYKNLIALLDKVGWIDKTANTNKCSEPYDISIVYIKPNEEAIKDTVVISFDDVIASIMENHDEVTLRFIESLRKWKTNPNL